MIRALQGTRMGRKVKTPAEAIAEVQESVGNGLENQVSQSGLESMRLDEVVGNPGNQVMNGYPDIFSFRDLHFDFNEGRVTMTDVEVPDGRWGILQVRAFYPLEQLTHTEYVCLSSGTHHWNPSEKQVCANDFIVGSSYQILPLRAHYWFLRAAYETYSLNEDPEIKRGVEKYLQTSLGDTVYHYAETIRWVGEPFGMTKAEVHTWGWDPRNFFAEDRKSEKIDISKAQIAWALDRLPALTYLLFDDPNPARVQKVLNFGAFGKNPNVKLILDTDKPGWGSIYFTQQGEILNLAGNSQQRGYARSLCAPAELFTPRSQP